MCKSWRALLRSWRNSLLVLMGFVMATSVLAETKVGDMSASEAFHDSVTVKWIAAVEQGDYKKADQWLAQGAKVNLVGGKDITPILWMMGAKRPAVGYLEYMLKAGADPNYVAPANKLSPMYFAAGGDNPEILRLFLKYKGNPNLIAPDIAAGEARILFVTALQGRLENIKILLASGADINWQDKNGETAADVAVSVGRFDIAAYCLEHGLNVELDGLLWSVLHSQVSPDSGQNIWKNKVITMLKERGVKGK